MFAAILFFLMFHPQIQGSFLVSVELLWAELTAVSVLTFPEQWTRRKS